MTESLPLAGVVIAVAALSLAVSPRSVGADGFFGGRSGRGEAPGLLTLTFSQVTTWIFARSLLTAGILGFYYGIAGALAYAAYYLSFLTGAAIIRKLRFKDGHDTIQGFLSLRFGRAGRHCYNGVTAARLLSEVFANLLVVGIVFGAQGSSDYTLAVVGVAGVALAYSLFGGLRASLVTDVVQMSLFLATLGLLLVFVAGADGLSIGAIAQSSPDLTSPGWVLLAVALLQVWSYPMHDPVMMDRGFLSDRKITLASFYHAAWISALCILAFGLLGVYAGLNAQEGEDMIAALTRLLGSGPMLVFNAALLISAMSTLDSSLSSASKLVVVDNRWLSPTVSNGRIVMAAFMVVGLGLVFLDNDDLFAAVAVSGTASMFLAPVIFFSLWGGRDVPTWSFVTAFALAIGGAALYFVEQAAYTDWITLVDHKYSKLLIICLAVLAGGCLAFAIGAAQRGWRAARLSAPA
ncbi:MAG: sodium:proline symporter [Pseudomonadota bacterium]